MAAVLVFDDMVENALKDAGQFYPEFIPGTHIRL